MKCKKNNAQRDKNKINEEEEKSTKQIYKMLQKKTTNEKLQYNKIDRYVFGQL